MAFFALVLCAGIGFLAWRISRGEVDFSSLPETFGHTLMILGGHVIALALVGSVLLPAVHRFTTFLERVVAGAFIALRRGTPQARVVLLLSAPFCLPVYVVAFALRLVLIIAVFAMLAGAGVFMIRLVDGHFLDSVFRSAGLFR